MEGIRIDGLFDRLAVNSKYSVYDELSRAGINVSVWQGEGKLHNKIFFIDNKTWIIGSYNPTKNGNEKNDENLLVLEQ